MNPFLHARYISSTLHTISFIHYDWKWEVATMPSLLSLWKEAPCSGLPWRLTPDLSLAWSIQTTLALCLPSHHLSCPDPRVWIEETSGWVVSRDAGWHQGLPHVLGNICSLPGRAKATSACAPEWKHKSPSWRLSIAKDCWARRSTAAWNNLVPRLWVRFSSGVLA